MMPCAVRVEFRDDAPTAEVFDSVEHLLPFLRGIRFSENGEITFGFRFCAEAHKMLGFKGAEF
jgi:hypothetical protein